MYEEWKLCMARPICLRLFALVCRVVELLVAIRALTGPLGAVGPAGVPLGGVTGVVLCAFALYAAAAFMIEETSHHSWLPLGRRSRGRRAITGDLGQQLEHIANEAGVREQL